MVHVIIPGGWNGDGKCKEYSKFCPYNKPASEARQKKITFEAKIGLYCVKLMKFARMLKLLKIGLNLRNIPAWHPHWGLITIEPHVNNKSTPLYIILQYIILQ